MTTKCVIGITGGLSAGKTSIAKELTTRLAEQRITVSLLHQPTCDVMSFNAEACVAAMARSNAECIIIEGPLVLYRTRLASLIDIKVYIDCDQDVSLSRWVKSRVRANEKVRINQYINKIKPQYDGWVAAQKDIADIIIVNNGRQKDWLAHMPAIDLLYSHVCRVTGQ